MEASECRLETHDQRTLEAAIQFLVAQKRREEPDLRDAHAVLTCEVGEGGGYDLIASQHGAHQPRLACQRRQAFSRREARSQGGFPNLRESRKFSRRQ